jgi:PAS domain S-box-containing protein
MPSVFIVSSGESTESRASSHASLRILLVEDLEGDAELMLRELRLAGLAFTSQRVQREAPLRQALHDFVPDVVLSDHSLPGFSGQDVLRVVQTERPRTPVIIVTGSLDEETAAEYIKAGAAEYIVKHRLFRLAPAVKRALVLREALEGAAKAEAAVARSEQRFRKLVEYSSDVVTLLDAAGHIVYSSQSLKPTLGYGAGELTGHSVFSLVHPDDRPAAEALFRDVQQQTAPVVRASLRVRHKGGSWRDLEVVAGNHLADPVVEAIVVNYHDVTERKRAEAALHEFEEQHRQVQKMEAVGRLASGVAHDFNNLLTVITSYAQLLLEDFPPDDARRGDLAEIQKAAADAAGLTRQLLAFSRQQVIEPRLVSLDEAVGSAQKMLTRLIDESITLITTLSEVPATVRIDPGQLEQVIMNLTVNARDAMPTGGRITIETVTVELDEAYAQSHWPATAGRFAKLVVSDTGVGMDEQTRERIFEPFFTTKEVGKGTGLGLATVYGIVKQSGGFIWVDSEPGRGSTFAIYFPVVDEPAERLSTPAASPEASRGSETVLLCEDAPGVRAAARQVLERYGYTVLEASTAQAALDFAARHPGPIHALLTDVVMPEMSGRQLADQFSGLRPDARILYISGYTDDAVVRHGVMEHGIAFLQKPFTPQTLAHKIRQVLDGDVGARVQASRILLIDDDAALRMSTRRMLERAGYEVLEAGDGEAGIRLLRAELIHLVLTDIYMPGEDGFATIRRLRRDWPGLKIITMSGGLHAGPTDLNAIASVLGAARTLSKPFDRADLLDAVRSVLGQGST